MVWGERRPKDRVTLQVILVFTLTLVWTRASCTGVCVFDGTYYKITTTNYTSKTSLYTTLLGSFWGNLFSLFQPEIYFFYTF
jgi:hypothetical protein